MLQSFVGGVGKRANYQGQPLVADGEPDLPGIHGRFDKLVELLQEPMHYTGVLAAVAATLHAPLSAPARVGDIVCQELAPGQEESWCWGFQVHSVQRRNTRGPAPTLACSEQISAAATIPRQIPMKGSTSMVCGPVAYQTIFHAVAKAFGLQGRPTMVRCLRRALPSLGGGAGGA